jgi:AcrR family transcriptional regulator
VARASRRRAAARPYHHGNLAPALIEAALALLDETQDWAFSLREVARRADVSHNAPYKHFPEKRDLLAAVAAHGFEALAGDMAAARAGAQGARPRIIACGRAYAAHGVANPALYRLMFGAALTTPASGRPAVEKTAGARARGIFEETLAEGVRAGEFPSNLANPSEHAAATLAMWSALHGLTMLAIDDFVGPPAAVESLVEPILGALLDGITSNPPAIPPHIWIAPRL